MSITSDPRIGTELAGYRVEALVGRGGMGVVYRAQDVGLNRPIALKILAPELAADARFRDRFLRESQLAASIDHPNVIPIYDAGEADGQLYIAMRFVEGTDLKALLRREGALEPVRALTIVKQIAAALDVAHERGLVHRDVKPANVLIDSKGGSPHAYLSDFGLTKSASPGTNPSVAGQFLGTIDYVAPEQIRGEPVDGRSDLYALGCLLFECLTGEVPFHRESEVAVIYAHLQERPPAVSAHLPRLPAGLDAVLGRAMAKKPADRYSSCREFVLATEAALAVPGDRRGRGRRPVVLAAAGLVLAAALATGLVLSFGGRGRSTRPPVAAAPVGYGVSLAEQLSTGAPGAQPDLTLFAVLDDGRGALHGLGSGPPPQTGEISFRIDRRQLEPDRGESGVYNLLGDPNGTQIGYFSASPPGDDRVQEPLRKVGVSRDAKSGDSIVRLAQPISSTFRRLAGEPTLPVTVRIGSRELVFTFNAQKLARAAAAAGISYSVSWFSLHLFGSYRRFGGIQTQRLRNPAQPTTFRAYVSARACGNPMCTRLGPTVHDSALIVLPRRLTVNAPRRTLYGQPSRFRGTGTPGDFVTVAYERRPGTARPCTMAKFQHPPDCAPRFRPALRKLTERRTRIARDGTWSLALPLRSATSIDGPAQLPQERAVSGRYVAVEYSGRRIWGPWPPVGGSFSVLAESPEETMVALAKPTVGVARRGKTLAIAVSIKGADRFVRVAVRFRGAVVAAGTTNDEGRFEATIPMPRRRGVLDARASAEGARSSISQVVAGPATA